jgi:hypothetical protein
VKSARERRVLRYDSAKVAGQGYEGFMAVAGMYAANGLREMVPAEMEGSVQ